MAKVLLLKLVAVPVCTVRVVRLLTTTASRILPDVCPTKSKTSVVPNCRITFVFSGMVWPTKVTVTVYGPPGSRLGIRKRPFLSVCDNLTAPFRVFTTFIVAPGSGAPLSSFTLPLILLVVTGALNKAGNANNQIKTGIILLKFI